MDILLPEGSPLAEYLEGRGQAEEEDEDTQTTVLHPQHSFAPRGAPRLFSTIARTKVYKSMHDGPVARIRWLYAQAVASTLGGADNERFLEHFRYILIASQLVNEQIPVVSTKDDVHTHSTTTSSSPLSLVGAIASATVAFAAVWAIKWSRGSQSPLRGRRLPIAVLLLLIGGVILLGYFRRQWLQHVRQQAVKTASDFVTNVQSFESTVTSTLSLIQEVELVARGYQLSTPLPPISRIDGGSIRRCVRLRRQLLETYQKVIPVIKGSAETLKEHALRDDLERFLDAYDVRHEDVTDAFRELDGEEESERSLQQLRMYQVQLSTLRRLVVCCLLSVPANGRRPDTVRWGVCVQEMERLCTTLAEAGHTLSKFLQDEDYALQLSPVTDKSSNRTSYIQSRRTSALTSGVRSVQAKLYLFREDSSRAQSTTHSEEGQTSLSKSLRDQYDSIGADLRSLLHAWETSRPSIFDDLPKPDHRASRTSSSLRGSMPSSLGGLTAVDEDDDNEEPQHAMSPRSAALLKLTGDRPLTPSVTESEDDDSRDGEVFEAVAAPFRPRSILTRDQRIAKMHEEREAQALARERREASRTMMRELQAVINLRPSTSKRRNTVIG